MYPPQPIWGPKYDEEYLRHQGELTDKLVKLKNEIEKMPDNDLEQFKDQKLPLARIKKIMKSDEDVRMISAEAPILFAKACEMFIIEMTHKAYYYAKKNNRKTLQRNDIAAAITDTQIYDFLLDIMPRDEIINNAKDKQLSAYQRQLLDDAWNIQQLQSQQMPPLPGQGVYPPAPPLPQSSSLSSSAAQQQQLSTQNQSLTTGGAFGGQASLTVGQEQRELSYQNEDDDEQDDDKDVDSDSEEQKKPATSGKGNSKAAMKDEEDEEANEIRISKKNSNGADHNLVKLESVNSNLQDSEDNTGGSDQKRRSQRQVNKKTYK